MVARRTWWGLWLSSWVMDDPAASLPPDGKYIQDFRGRNREFRRPRPIQVRQWSPEEATGCWNCGRRGD